MDHDVNDFGSGNLLIRRITQILILVSVALWIAWDIYATQTHGATESEVIRDWQLAYPGVSWGVGVVFGHLVFLRKKRIVAGGLTGPLILGVLSCAVVAFTLLVDLSWHWVPGLGAGGVAAGHFLWAQKPKES
jgi:hypothetical protein